MCHLFRECFGRTVCRGTHYKLFLPSTKQLPCCRSAELCQGGQGLLLGIYHSILLLDFLIQSIDCDTVTKVLITSHATFYYISGLPYVLN